MLPDDVLLEIFDFYLDENKRYYEKREEWIALAHVCRRWRSLVFQSPHRLNLQLVCTPYTRTRDTLAAWPPVPLIISDDYRECYDYDELDNIFAALEHNDRVCQIDLSLPGSEFEPFTNLAAMQKPFPELTELRLSCCTTESELPDLFLGGTAPSLRSLYLRYVPFPGLPKLLLSAAHLVKLELYLPYLTSSGYIPLEAMATSLSSLTSLEFLRLHYQSPVSPPHPSRPALENRRQTPPPLTRSVLPGLATIIFKGPSEYLEEILARTDAPRVKNLDITFFEQIRFDTPQLFQFISRRPTLRAPEMGCIKFDFITNIVKFRSRISDFGELKVEIPCTASEWQFLSLEQVCPSSLPLVSTLKDLSIYEKMRKRYLPPHWHVANTLWLELLRPFAAVKNLYLSRNSVRRIAPALQELVGGRTTEVFPALENIILEGFWKSDPLHKGIEKFVAARRLIGHSVAVSALEGQMHLEILRL
jgi:hypothetical protein